MRFAPFFLAGLSALAVVVSMQSCDGTSATSPAKSEAAASGWILTSNGAPIPGVVVYSPRLALRDTTDSLGRWKLSARSAPQAPGSVADTLRLSVEGAAAGTAVVPSWNQTLPDIRLVRRTVQGTVDSVVFQIQYNTFALHYSHQVRLVIARRDDEHDTVAVPFDSIASTFQRPLWFVDGDPSQTGRIWAEVVDSLGVSGRSTPDTFDVNSGDLRLTTFDAWNLAPSFYLGSSSWRFRDTVRLQVQAQDSASRKLVSSVWWRTSPDTTWKLGPDNLLVQCPSRKGPPLTVSARVETREGRFSPIQQVTFDTSTGFGQTAYRIPTPPKLSYTLPLQAPIDDSIWVVTHVWDTLGGQVVRRFIAWGWGDTVQLHADSQKVYLPDRRTDGSFSGRIEVVDNDAETTTVYVGIHIQQPAPRISISQPSPAGFQISWEPTWNAGGWVSNWDQAHVRIVDPVSGTVLTDTLVAATSLGMYRPRSFFDKVVRTSVRFQYSWSDSADASAWGSVVDTLPAGGINPLQLVSGLGYRPQSFTAGQSRVVLYDGSGYNLVFLPDSGILLGAGTANLTYDFTYYGSLLFQDTLSLDVATIDSFPLQIALQGPPDTANLRIGWEARTVRTGHQTFLAADLRLLVLDNMGNPSTSLPLGWHGWTQDRIAQQARTSQVLDILSPCARTYTQGCQDPGKILQIYGIDPH